MVPYELEEYYDYVGQERALPVSGGTESQPCQNGSGSPEMVSYVGKSNLEPPNTGAEKEESICVPGALFPIPEEDTQVESSSSRSRSDPSSSSNGSVFVAAVGSLPSPPSSSYREFAASFTSGSGFVVNHSTPGTSNAGSRTTHRGTAILPIATTPAQTALRGTGIPGSPPNAGTPRLGAHESYTGSGDLNDGTEVSGACMNGLYEELEEWGCEWILQNQQQSGPPTRGGKADIM